MRGSMAYSGALNQDEKYYSGQHHLPVGRIGCRRFGRGKLFLRVLPWDEGVEAVEVLDSRSLHYRPRGVFCRQAGPKREGDRSSSDRMRLACSHPASVSRLHLPPSRRAASRDRVHALCLGRDSDPGCVGAIYNAIDSQPHSPPFKRKANTHTDLTRISC